MIKITSIKDIPGYSQVKRVYLVDLDNNNEYSFDLNPVDINHFKLKEGLKITEVVYEQIVKLIKFKKAYNEALRILSYKNYTSQEIYKKLLDKGFEQNTIQQAVHELKQKKYLNDEEYAKLWLENHYNLKPFGKKRIYWELTKKGISKEIIEKLISSIPEDYEYQTALKLANNRIKRYSNHSIEKKLNKVAAFLNRRGFSKDVIIKILQNINESPLV